MLNNLYLLVPIAGLFLLGSVLTGCSTPNHKSIRTVPDIPAASFECDLPSIRPSGDNIMESDVANYINSLEFSNKDCLTKLKQVQVLIKCSKEPDCNPKILLELLEVAKPNDRR